MSTARDPISRTVRGASLVLLATGGLSRVAPLLDQHGRLLRQFPTEDGYLMLTIARNLALGLGPTVADGTIVTNGTQPLATGLFAAAFWLVGADRYWGVLTVLLVELAIACTAAHLVWRLGTRTFRHSEHRSELSLLAAGAWFASPLVVQSTMNCLESGLYAVCVLIVALLIVPGTPKAPGAPTMEKAYWARMGTALGVAFLARNDGVLLCLAVGFVHLAGKLARSEARLPTRVAELAIAAGIVTLIALPWLAFNWWGFGHLMPISGQAESLSAEIGGNLWIVPPKLLEYVTLLTPIPTWIEESPIVVALSTVALVILAAGLTRAGRHAEPTQRALFAVFGTYTALLGAFYGVYFGAPHFMSRYLFPTAAFFAVAGAALALSVAGRGGVTLARIGSAVAVLAAVGLNVRIYVQGSEHMHFQVVEWVEANVPDEAWVGAIQSGTLGFFHDRTINLDGKVNPRALAARREDAIPAYVAASRIDYLVDWAGIATWHDKAELSSTFELVVEDRARNLGVLRRRDVARAAAEAHDGRSPTAELASVGSSQPR